MNARTPFLRILSLPAILALLPGAAVTQAHAFGRVNLVVTPAEIDGVPGSPDLKRWSDARSGSMTVWGDSVLFTDLNRGRVLRLHQGALTVVAGFQHVEGMEMPGTLLGLRDQTVLIAGRDPEGRERILRLRPQPKPGEPWVSPFAGGPGQAGEGTAPGLELQHVAAMAEAPDGSVLVCDDWGSRVLRVDPDGTARVVAGTGIDGRRLDPSSGLLTQLSDPMAVAVREDASILIADTDNHRVLQVWPDRVAVLAGLAPDAVHPVALHAPSAIALLPDQSLWVLDQARPGEAQRLLRITPAGVSQLAGPDTEGLLQDPHGYQDRRLEASSIHRLLALQDGSVLVGAEQGILLLSPADALQARLEHLVDQGRDAIRAANRTAYRHVVTALAHLCVPTPAALRALNRAARDQGHPPWAGLPWRLQPPTPLVELIHGWAAHGGGEQLRAQLALKELKQDRRDQEARRKSRKRKLDFSTLERASPR